MSATITTPDGLGPADRSLTGHLAPDQARRYLTVPFAVPEGIEQLHVRYDYSDRIASDPDLDNGNTLDIGLFDEHGSAAGSPGFRGWSGSDKLAFTIGRNWATPPYRPGPIGAGTWSVLLGPYKVAAQGLDYRVEIWFDPGLADRPIPPAAPAWARREIASPAEAGWVRADLHSHTVFSDGDSWPVETMAAAWNVGLDVIGITDHNSAISASKYAAGLAGGPLLVPGVETTTYGGHWNSWAAPGAAGHRWYDFREPTGPATEAAMAAAVAAGAFVSINHPKPLGPPWLYPEVTSFHAVEVWNGDWDKLNTVALAYWEALLRQGRPVVAVGGSDTHHLHTVRRPRFGIPDARFGTPTMFIRVGGGPLTIATVLAALRRGDCFISESPTGPELYVARATDTDDAPLTVRVVGAASDTLSVIGPDGAAFAAAVPSWDWSVAVPFPAGTPWLRAQVTDRVGRVRALSNAVWRSPE
jgi:predicted metal-dependent phosphoesterase TrpH